MGARHGLFFWDAVSVHTALRRSEGFRGASSVMAPTRSALDALPREVAFAGAWRPRRSALFFVGLRARHGMAAERACA